jgi:CRP/FNR family transcriptional regulator, cyclic AMP receptor protein
VVNKVGKEAVVAVLGPGDFVGEACLADQPNCMATATAIAPTTVLVIEKDEMSRVLHAEHALSDRFISHMLARNVQVEKSLIDQLLNSSEKRLARTLLLLACYGAPGHPHKVLPKVSQEMLAGMIGTTRSRVNFFHEQIQETGIYPIRWSDPHQRFTPKRRPPRLAQRQSRQPRSLFFVPRTTRQD